MIQRIQTIFLFLAAAGIGGLFALPFTSSSEAVAESAILNDSTYNVYDDPVMMGLFGGAALMALIAIFLFKNRVLQMRMGLFSILLTIAASAWGIYLFFQESEKLSGMQLSFGAGLALPLVSLILILVANRFIKKDEKLVKSMDRLR